MNLYSPKVLILLFVLAIIVPGTSCHSADLGAAKNPRIFKPLGTPVAASETPRININTADVETLRTLEGIGPKLADSIVAHRERYGQFSAPEQLMLVERIGEKLFLRIRKRIKVKGR